MATYQSLYRRYRSQRFDEVLGQDHVTQALRNAVREGRVGHAYLFSGPRGTGKTSTARILAKVLNCAAPEDGEPCGKCENCVAVAEGRVTDWLLEQDAASKSKVDDMRDLLDRVPLGTSGNRKVIILDEVHMLSQGAENALLKTLEEPPAHVVFVLATTDPQKVRPTILSRTQHFKFRLLPPDVLADHVRHVIADAGLAIDPAAVDEAVDHVLRIGGGSARDTLSALDQVAALGRVVDEAHPVDAIIDALADRDAGRVLVAVAQALAAGRDPRGLGEALIAALRDAFLALMGAADDHLAPAARDRAAEVGQRLGAAGLTRALDVLGEVLTELSRKPDPRVVVEVALVRLTQPSTDRTLDAILERLDRLERGASPGTPGPAGGDASGSGGADGSGPAGGARGRRPGGASGSAGAAAAGDPAGGGVGGSGPAGPVDAGPAARADAGDETPRARSSPSGGTGGRPEATGRQGRGGASAARDALSSARRAEQGTADPAARRTGKPTLGAVTRGRAAGSAAGDDRAAAGSGADGPQAGSAGDDRAPAGSGGDGPQAAAPVTASPTAAAATTAQPDAPEASTATASSAASPGQALTLAQVEASWAGQVLAALPVKIRSKWRAGRWAEPGDDGSWRFAVPNAWHQSACDEARAAVEQALASHFGHPVPVSVVVAGDDPLAGAAASLPGAAEAAGTRQAGIMSTVAPVAPLDDPDEHIDPDELRDAHDVTGNGVDLVLREFGGGQVVEEDP